MARARLLGWPLERAYELVNMTGNAEVVLRDERNEVTVEQVENVEFQCERCGRFSRDVAPAATGRWACYATDSADACAEAADDRGGH